MKKTLDSYFFFQNIHKKKVLFKSNLDKNLPNNIIF